MRHRIAGRSFGRPSSHRKALLRNLTRSLMTHERIKTTEAKAKEVRKVADRLVTLALRNDLHSRREAYRVLGNHQLVKKLFDEIGPRFSGVPGGFTRIIRLGMPRLGDGAPLVLIELSRNVDVAAAPAATEEPAKPKAKAKPKAAASAETSAEAPKAKAKPKAKPQADTEAKDEAAE